MNNKIAGDFINELKFKGLRVAVKAHKFMPEALNDKRKYDIGRPYKSRVYYNIINCTCKYINNKNGLAINTRPFKLNITQDCLILV